MGVRLLTRTTRSVSPTDAGDRPLQNVAPRLEEIEAEIAAVSDLGGQPAGTVRITPIDHVIETILWPRLAPLLPQYPDLRVELNSEYRLIDIAAERFDIGVRYGDQVDKDTIAVRLTQDVPMMIVGAPAYFARRPVPAIPEDLVKHNCITLRLVSSGVYAWELQRQGRDVEVRVKGQVMCTSALHMHDAALSGCSLALLPEQLVGIDVGKGA